MKWQKIILMALLALILIPSVMAFTRVEYSTDNSTWTYYGNTNNGQMTVATLQAETQYYFRVQHVYNGYTSNWEYLSQMTKAGGINKMEIILFGVLGVITFGLIYLLVHAQYKPVQIALGLLVGAMFFVDFYLAARAVEVTNAAQTGIISNLDVMYMITLYLFRALLIAAVLYALFWLVQTLFSWQKKKKMQRLGLVEDFKR